MKRWSINGTLDTGLSGSPSRNIYLQKSLKQFSKARWSAVHFQRQIAEPEDSLALQFLLFLLLDCAKLCEAKLNYPSSAGSSSTVCSQSNKWKWCWSNNLTFCQKGSKWKSRNVKLLMSLPKSTHWDQIWYKSFLWRITQRSKKCARL